MRGNAQPTVVHERLPGARLRVATCCLAVNLKPESELQWSFTAPETGKFSAASCNIHATITTGADVGQFATRGQPCTVLIYRFS
jgi:hypothetical protein